MNSKPKPFILLGNHPCMDFVNTRKNRKGTRVELLESFSDVLDWFQSVGLLDEAERRKTNDWETAARWADSLHTITTSIIHFRDRLEDELFQRVLKGSPVSLDFLCLLNEWLQTYKSYTEIVPIQAEEGSDQAPAYRISKIILPEAGPQQLQAWIAELVSEFLSTQELGLIHQCENPNCILFFHDNSKNRKRRWCSMKTCGNRMKAAEFYRKKKENG
jgi:predicted RNA-binding Zn ribbon-like protein